MLRSYVNWFIGHLSLLISNFGLHDIHQNFYPNISIFTNKTRTRFIFLLSMIQMTDLMKLSWPRLAFLYAKVSSPSFGFSFWIALLFPNCYQPPSCSLLFSCSRYQAMSLLCFFDCLRVNTFIALPVA